MVNEDKNYLVEQSKDTLIDVNYKSINSDDKIQYYTTEEVAISLNVEEVDILFWCNKFKEELKVQSVNAYLAFNSSDIQNLKIIKELIVDKGLNESETKKYLADNKNVILVKRVVDNDIAVFEFFAKIISHQNQKIDGLIQSQNQFMQMLSKIYDENSLNNEKLLEGQISQTEYIKTLERKLDNLSEIAIEKLDMLEHEFQKRDVEKITAEKQSMETRRILYEINETEKNKGFFKKLFRK